MIQTSLIFPIRYPGWAACAGLVMLLTACGGSSDSTTAPPPNLGQIQGIHYDDLNGNGERDSGEPGLAGAVAFLDQNQNGQLDSGELSTTSDSGGNFTFFNLSAGSYRVAAVVPADRIQTQPDETDRTGLIVGGADAAEGAFPWMAGLLIASDPNTLTAQFCAGSLITSEWVLTAAHCFFSTDTDRQNVFPDDLEILLGTNTLGNDSGTRLAVSEIVIHPDYDPSDSQAGGSDLALVKLVTPSPLTPIPLVTSEASTTPGTESTIIGWGATNPRGLVLPPSGFPTELQEAQVPIQSNATCNAPSSYDGILIDSMLCAGFLEGGVDTCQGDSGGPLIVGSGSSALLAGITSFGFGCAQPDFPGIYTRVSSFVSFVTSITGSTPEAPAGFYTINLAAGQVVTNVDFGSRRR
ncbi:MAG: trypsin-like serine protease [Cyanobacteriota bacterium]|nr:trypsin-like serine protease [Cyanobacteriota bacterium]